MPKSRRRPSAIAITGCVRDITSANKAPGGFGLGAIWNQAPENDANQIPGTGWFVAHQNTPTGGWWIIQDIFDGGVHYQFAFAKRSNSGVLGGTIVQRNKQEQNDWSPWEWVNPPMNLNTEYRTTERYMRKPVYCKLVDLGEGTNGKTVNVGTTEMIHVECRATYSSWSLPMPELPFGSTDRSLEHTNAQAFYSNANTVTIIKGSTCPAFTATAKVYYIRSTD